MRTLVVVVLLAALGYSGYWLVGARAVERSLQGWIEERRAEGWVADYATLDTRGFPNRFDTTLTELELADPATGVAWRAPFFQILALSYRPNHVIAVWPESQSLASPYERIEIGNADMRASVVFEPGTRLTLDRATFVLDALTLGSNLGWRATLETGRLAVRQTAARENTYDIGFEATDLAPSEALLSSLDPTSALPGVIEGVHLDATVSFDAPWDRIAIEEARPQPTAIDLRETRASWGELELRAAGELAVDEAGVPEGRITLKATNWREMLDLAVAAGALPEGLSGTAETVLETLAGLSGDSDTLDVPLSFRRGGVSLGPIPLGRAPRLVLR